MTRILTLLLSIALLTMTLPAIGQQCIHPPDDLIPAVGSSATASPMVVVAFGTSLMWGDGLLEQNTFRYRTAQWLATYSGRPVRLATYAHSAAVLAAQPDASYPVNPVPDIGDLNYSLPSVDDQIACAARGLAHPDLILVEGCINDVGAESIALPWTQPGPLKSETEAACGPAMLKELQKIDASFPNAAVVVAGYYPLVSKNSTVFGFFGLSGTRRVVNRAKRIRDQKALTRQKPITPPQPKTSMSHLQEHDRMADNSELFYQTSKKALKEDIQQVNASAPSPRFFYAQLPEGNYGYPDPTVNPNLAYGAPNRHLWMISFRFFHLFAFYKDQKYWYRVPLCDDPRNVPDLLERPICETSPAFHPNDPGSEVYTDSIIQSIPSAIKDTWKH
jgi:hypothetical protein